MLVTAALTAGLFAAGWRAVADQLWRLGSRLTTRWAPSTMQTRTSPIVAQLKHPTSRNRDCRWRARADRALPRVLPVSPLKPRELGVQ